MRKRHSPAANLGSAERDQAPWEEPGGGHWSHGGQGWGYSRGLSRGPGALSRPAVPTPSFDPHMTSASRHKRASATLGLGHMVPGCEQLAQVAPKLQRLPSRRPHCEDPLVRPSVKGSPFTDGRTRGRPPGDGFPPSRRCLVWGPEAGPRRRRQATSPQACLRATGPTLEISCQVHRVPGVLSGETEVLPATQRTPRFLLHPTSQQLSNPGRGRVPREDLGT